MKNAVIALTMVIATATGVSAKTNAEVAMDRIIGAIDGVKISIAGELDLVYQTLDTKIQTETLKREIADQKFADKLEEESGFWRSSFDTLKGLVVTETEERIREDLALKARVDRLEQQVAILMGEPIETATITEEATLVVSEPVVEVTKLMYAVNVKALNFRLKADKTSTKLGVLLEDTEVEVIDIDNYGWAKVIAQGKTGYVAARYLAKR